jgi:hypothetical protein
MSKLIIFLIVVGIFMPKISTKDLNNICFDLNTKDVSLKVEIGNLDTEEISFKFDLKLKTKKNAHIRLDKKCAERVIHGQNISSKTTVFATSTHTSLTKANNEEFVCNKKYEYEICLTRQMLIRLVNDPLAQWEIKLIGKKIVVKNFK